MSEQKTHKVTLVPGDGIGPEVTQAVVRILEATGVKFDWERFAAGAEAFEIHGDAQAACARAPASRPRLARHRRNLVGVGDGNRAGGGAAR